MFNFHYFEKNVALFLNHFLLGDIHIDPDPIRTLTGDSYRIRII